MSGSIKPCQFTSCCAVSRSSRTRDVVRPEIKRGQLRKAGDRPKVRRRVWLPPAITARNMPAGNKSQAPAGEGSTDTERTRRLRSRRRAPARRDSPLYLVQVELNRCDREEVPPLFIQGGRRAESVTMSKLRPNCAMAIRTAFGTPTAVSSRILQTTHLDSQRPRQAGARPVDCRYSAGRSARHSSVAAFGIHRRKAWRGGAADLRARLQPDPVVEHLASRVQGIGNVSENRSHRPARGSKRR